MNMDLLLNILKYLKRFDITDEAYIALLDTLLPDSIGYRFNDSFNKTAAFYPSDREIVISKQRVEQWLLLNSMEFSNEYLINDVDSLRYYLFIFIFLHEVQHSKQFLISTGEVESYKLLKDSYNELFKIMSEQKEESIPLVGTLKKISRNLKLYRYNKNSYIYSLERDANIEGYKQLRNLAKLDNNKEMQLVSAINESNYIRLGYEDNKTGSIKQTMYDIGLIKEYNNLDLSEDIPLEDKVRYGIELNDEEAEKLILKNR